MWFYWFTQFIFTFVNPHRISRQALHVQQRFRWLKHTSSLHIEFSIQQNYSISISSWRSTWKETWNAAWNCNQLSSRFRICIMKIIHKVFTFVFVTMCDSSGCSSFVSPRTCYGAEKFLQHLLRHSTQCHVVIKAQSAALRSNVSFNFCFIDAILSSTAFKLAANATWYDFDSNTSQMNLDCWKFIQVAL